jgi:ribA/ribD-fused uncharacterized protein
MIIDGQVWSTVEHYFQAMKSKDIDVQKMVRDCFSPSEAKKLGRNIILRSDWEEVKEKIMFRALLCKFLQSQYLQDLLLLTRDEHLVEDSPTDYYWGCGQSGTGLNRLGELLIKVRSFLRKLKFNGEIEV